LVDVVIDSREPKAREFQAALLDEGVSSVVEALDAGDFLIYGGKREGAILIERKEAGDFLHSITSEKKNGTYKTPRIWNQIKRMQETGLNTYVLIEGDPFNKENRAYFSNGVTTDRIRGSMRGIENWGVKIHRENNTKGTLDWVVFLAKRMKKPKSTFTLRTSPPNTMTLKEKKRYLIEGFPYIGSKKAKKIVNGGKLINFFKNIDKTTLVTEREREAIKEILYSKP